MLILISAVALALSCVADLFSIAICEILLGISLAAFLAALARRELRFGMPTIWLPLVFYMLWTVLAMFFSPPVTRHLPQLYKMWLFTILPAGHSIPPGVQFTNWFGRGF